MIWLVATALASDPAFVQLATGADFTCGRRTNGTVACWGNNEDHQLGVQTEALASSSPVDTGITGAVDIAASGVQACAVTAGGQIKCWGQTREAAWGTGELPRSMGMNTAAEVALGPARGCARRRGAYVDCWETVQTPLPDLSMVGNVVGVGVGRGHACALTKGGSVWCWGDDRKGQLGNDMPGLSSVPKQISKVADAAKLSVGEDNTCVVHRSGGVSCWGPNADGQLGTANATPAWGPQRVVGLDKAAEVSVGTTSVCARTTDGKVKCWGKDPCPRPDVVSRRFEPVDLGIRGATALSQGSLSDHMCAVVSGQAVCWGNDSHGQAGGDARCVVRP